VRALLDDVRHQSVGNGRGCGRSRVSRRTRVVSGRWPRAVGRAVPAGRDAGFAPEPSVPLTEYKQPKPGAIAAGRTPVI
jgi:hypothetical protein